MRNNRLGWYLLLVATIITLATYSVGLSGGYLFDDYPNIVDNHDVQPNNIRLSSLVGAALSSPSSEFKRPLASLSFAANYLATGLNPYWMKLTNLFIHLLNGLLVFLLTRTLFKSGIATSPTDQILQSDEAFTAAEVAPTNNRNFRGNDEQQRQANIVAALIAAGWMLLPINLTAVLYVVQRMESMANLFVLLGLIGYATSRQRMLEASSHVLSNPPSRRRKASLLDRNFILCLISITIPTALGILAKETAVMLPLYALLIEWTLFRFRTASYKNKQSRSRRRDVRIASLFLLVLVLPMAIGLVWILPGTLQPATWATRNFTLTTRLLSEARIVVDYLVWTVLPTPHDLSFYHDDFAASTGLLAPSTTLASIVFLAFLVTLTFWLRSRRPFVALGLALFLSCQLLTGTIIPLELIYEHRNYFASFGLLLALVPLLAAPPRSIAPLPARKMTISTSTLVEGYINNSPGALPMALPRYVMLGGLMLCWAALTTITAYAWGNPLRLAEELAIRAPQSPRAQYELGRTYIIASHYEPASPFIKLVYAPLERAAALPGSSILPEQALIFTNSRMRLPVKDAWWASLIAKLKARTPTVQDESSLAALTRCARDHDCELPPDHMMAAFMAALSHPSPDGRLLANYGDYCWNVLGDRALGENMTKAAVVAAPDEAAYRITLIRMLAVQGRKAAALDAINKLEALNYGGRLNDSLAELRALPGLQ